MGSYSVFRSSTHGFDSKRRQSGNRNVRVSRYTLFVLLVFAVFAFAGTATLSVAGDVTADETSNSSSVTNETATNETIAPVLDSGTKVNDTTMAVTIQSAVGLDNDSITAEEFFLSDGSLAGVSVVSGGTNATVELVLTEPLDVDEVVIGVASTTTIQDTDGNRLNVSKRNTVTVTGMDAVPPSVLGVEIPSIASNETAITYQFDEPVSALAVGITGPTEKTLDRDSFVRGANNRYTATVDLEEEGEHLVTLHNATDEAGNTAELDISSVMEINTSVPAAVATIDRDASERLALTFDAGGSDSTAESYHWSFGDGREATGERVEHVFHPGIYRVTLDVADAAGNVGSDELVVDLTSEPPVARTGPDRWPEEPTVSVERLSPAYGTDTLVTMSGVEANTPVRAVGTANQSLVAADGLTLDAMWVETTLDTSLGVGLTGIDGGSGALSDLETRTDREAVAGFEATPTVSDDVVSSVTFNLSLDSPSLADRDVESDDIVLYRGGDEWEALETTVIEENDDRYRLQATAPGYSSFVLTVPATEEEPDEPEDTEDETADTDEDEADEEDTDEEETDEQDEEETDEQDEADEEETDEADEEKPDEEDEEDTDEENESQEVEPPTEEEDPEETSALFGFVPNWLVMFVAVPLLSIYTSLKAVAFYLGY